MSQYANTVSGANVLKFEMGCVRFVNCILFVALVNKHSNQHNALNMLFLFTQITDICSHH